MILKIWIYALASLTVTYTLTCAKVGYDQITQSDGSIFDFSSGLKNMFSTEDRVDVYVTTVIDVDKDSNAYGNRVPMTWYSNYCLKNVKAYADKENMELRITFDFDWTQFDKNMYYPLMMPHNLMIRLFDKNGQYLTHFNTKEEFSLAPYDPLNPPSDQVVTKNDDGSINVTGKGKFVVMGLGDYTKPPQINGIVHSILKSGYTYRFPAEYGNKLIYKVAANELTFVSSVEIGFQSLYLAKAQVKDPSIFKKVYSFPK